MTIFMMDVLKLFYFSVKSLAQKNRLKKPLDSHSRSFLKELSPLSFSGLFSLLSFLGRFSLRHYKKFSLRCILNKNALERILLIPAK